MQSLESINPAFVVSILIIILFLDVISVTFLKYPFDRRIKLWGTGWLVFVILTGSSIIIPSSVFGPLDFLAIVGMIMGPTIMLNGSTQTAELFHAEVYVSLVLLTIGYSIVVYFLRVMTPIGYIIPEFYAGAATSVFLRTIWNHYPDHGPYVVLIAIGALGWTISAFGMPIIFFLSHDAILVYLTLQGICVSVIGLGIYGQSVRLSHNTLEHQNRLAMLLASVIHHDIRNYVYLISQTLELVQNDKENETEWLTVAVGITDKIANFLEEVRRVTGEIARYQKSERMINLTDMIRSAVGLIETVYKDKKLQIVNEVREEKIVHSNELAHQIIYNIMDNAVKHGTSYIEIKTEKTNKQIILTIADRAGGMPQHIIDYINNPCDLSKAPGIGLGLIIIKGLAPLCWMTVHVENVIDKEKPIGCTYQLGFSILQAEPQ